MGLLLRAVDVVDRHHWRWVLTDPETGKPLADHQVALDPTARGVRAFEDLPRYLRWRADPDRRAESEARLLEVVAAWLGLRVLGERIGQEIVAAAPVTVRVEVPPQAEFLLFRPLELAYADGVPLARRGDVSLVYEVGAVPRPVRPAGDRLRMLAIFSLPTAATALGLRRERYELARLIRRVAARRGRAVDLEVLQYGATRERLRERMTAGGGPEILHISGHGRTGELLLERSDGGPDPVPAEDLLGLLAPAAGRLRLAVVSACESAAARVAETLGLLGLTEAAQVAEAQAREEARPAPEAGIAHRLAGALDCAVVAMRYPVSDEFAIALAAELYEGMFGLDLPLDRALPRAVATAAGPRPSLSRPAISVATPTLFGAGAVGLTVSPPAGKPALDPAMVRMAHFPTEPARFVGRARVMAEASTALAPGSDHTAVLFHGMAGAGKTACALELAYGHVNQFAGGLAFWQAPTDPDEFGGALAGLAMALERQWGDHGFTMVDKIGTVADLRSFLPVLSRLLADNGLLLVLDNLETLLTGAGTWRDERWGELVTALTGHGGESRVILTSRVRPAGLDAGPDAGPAGRVLVAPVHALSRDESVLLARELPHLRRLLHTEPAPTRAPVAAVDADRATVTEVLRLVQGHPKLLELADAAAADPDRLAAQLTVAGSAAQAYGAVLPAFLGQGESGLDADGFLDVLTAWTTATVDLLPAEERLLCELLCLVEEADRTSDVVAGNWADLWRRLERPGDPPDPAGLLDRLAAAALVQPEPIGEKAMRYLVHPGVAEAVRAAAAPETRSAVDTELAAYWYTVAQIALDRDGGEQGWVVVRAGLAAAPYLIRLQEWGAAARLLELATQRDTASGTAHAALPYLRRVADATGAIDDLGLFAKVLTGVDPARAERLLREVLERAVSAGQPATASATSGHLANLLFDSGRVPEALDLLDQKVEHTRLAGLGPWTQLNDRGRRLPFLHRLGHDEQVLTEAEAMLAEMDRLPTTAGGPGDPVYPWNVREATLNAAEFAARDLGRWQLALDYNHAITESERSRGAGRHEMARTRFNSFRPLLDLGRMDAVEALLAECQQVYEENDDLSGLGKVFAARAMTAARRGEVREAVDLGQTALRLSYVRPDPRSVAVAHYNLASDLGRATVDPRLRIAHSLAAGLIFELAGMQGDRSSVVQRLANDLHQLGESADVPMSVAEVAGLVAQVEGVRFAEIVAALAPEPPTAEAALTALIQAARDLSSEQALDVSRHLGHWEPRIAALVAAVGGDPESAAKLDPELDRLAATSDWRDLVAALRRVLAGERDRATLTAGLDPIDTAILTAALDRIAQPTDTAPQEEPPVSTGTDLETLSDQEAVRVLALVVDHSGSLPDAAALREVEQRLPEAVDDPELPSEPPSDLPEVTAGDLARVTLVHLAARPEHAETVRRAVRIDGGDTTRSVEPASLAIGGLVLLALQTEVELVRSSTGRWRLRVHKAGLSDSTLGQVLAKLVTYFRPPPN